jgi:Tfp pilus assembly protein PilO
MKLDMKSTNGLIVAMLVVVGIAVAFWMLALSPKREEAAKLDARVGQLEASIALHQAEVAEGEAARKEFADDYQRLVVLGKAVPGDDDTASLLVQVTQIADKTGVEFRNLKLNPATGTGEAPAATAPPAGSEPVSATEAAAIGPAGLAVMPYTLTFNGSFFKIADFIKEIDSLVKTGNENVEVDGRLLTLDAFALAADKDKGFPALEVTFSITTYLTPPSEGETAGATPTSPGTALATPASSTIGETP